MECQQQAKMFQLQHRCGYRDSAPECARCTKVCRVAAVAVPQNASAAATFTPPAATAWLTWCETSRMWPQFPCCSPVSSEAAPLCPFVLLRCAAAPELLRDGAAISGPCASERGSKLGATCSSTEVRTVARRRACCTSRSLSARHLCSCAQLLCRSSASAASAASACMQRRAELALFTDNVSFPKLTKSAHLVVQPKVLLR